jgi:hypothetical protein
MLKRLLIVVAIIFVIIQFVRPSRNLSANEVNSITVTHTIPSNISKILRRSCNDCHSNYTDYRWYFNVQPLGWWLQHHVDEGRQHLNFSEFSAYDRKKKIHKLNEIIDQVEQKEMPLSLYEAIHPAARLSDLQRAAVSAWAKELLQELE